MPISGTQLKKHRQRLGLTQKQMAKQLGLHWNSLARMERDEIRAGGPVVKLVQLLIKLSRSKR